MERFEERDGKTFKVTVLPSDWRLSPSEARKRALFASLSNREKKQFFAEKKKAAARKRKRKKAPKMDR